MDYIGKWVFHSIGVFGDDGLVYYTADEFINSPILYIDETDTEAIAEEIRDRRNITRSELRLLEDGSLLVLLPIPEGVSEDEVNEAVEAGHIIICDGMITERPIMWEVRDGELWYNTEIVGEFCGEETDPWVRAVDDDGFFNIAYTRYAKAD